MISLDLAATRAQLTSAALASLLIDKGVITKDEYQKLVVAMGERIGLDLKFEESPPEEPK
jgi:hypothetical protein